MCNFVYRYRAGLPQRDPASTDPKSWMTGLGIFHITRAGYCSVCTNVVLQIKFSQQISILKGLWTIEWVITVKVAHKSANFRFMRKYILYYLFVLARQPASKVWCKHGMKSARQSKLAWVPRLACLHTNSLISLLKPKSLPLTRPCMWPQCIFNIC
jgi:hypothetical protein